MRVLRLVVAGAATFAAASCSDATSPVGPEAPSLSVTGPHHRVVGSGHVDQAAGMREFTFHAVEHPDGTAAGSYKIVLPSGLFFEADVTCLAVEGNTGWVGGVIRASNSGAVIIGSTSRFYAIDNGEGPDAGDVVSNAVFNGAAGADLAFCADRPLNLGFLAVARGNVGVR